jgi:hypothetical protein
MTDIGDCFYAIFQRVGDDGWGQRATQAEAEKSAKTMAERNPHLEYFVMKSIIKFAGPKPEIVRTEIESYNRKTDQRKTT